MRQKGTLKYDIVIYLCLFVAFVCAIGSCIEPSSAVSEAPSKEIEKEPIVQEIEEPKHLLKVDKYSVAQKYIDSIVDQIITDNTITYDMVTTWSTYSIKNMKYKKILFLFLISGLVFSGCGKKDVQEEVSTEMVIDVPSYQVTATPVPTRTAAPTEKPLEVKKDGTLED